MLFSIIIPAYNEEKIIKDVVYSCLRAREKFLAAGICAGCEIIVVDDGSTDATAALVHEFEGVKLLRHKKNKGYGAALAYGFREARGDVFGFMDGDGTCDPSNFKPMLECIAAGYDLIIGLRLHKNSKMPFTRRVGNRFFAGIINFIGRSDISDAASGMRVFKQKILDILMPLPTDLSFTPAMSAKAILDNTISIKEVPITYVERVGKSKLNIAKDGFIFLKTILTIGFLYRPFKIFGGIGLLLILASVLISAVNQRLTLFAFGIGLYLFFTGSFMNEVLFALHPFRRLRKSPIYFFFAPTRSPSALLIATVACLIIAAVIESIIAIYALLLAAIQFLAFSLLFYLIRAMAYTMRSRINPTD